VTGTVGETTDGTGGVSMGPVRWVEVRAAAILSLVGAGLAPACGPPPERVAVAIERPGDRALEHAGTPSRGDALVVAVLAEPDTLNPVVEAHTVGNQLNSSLYPSLLDDDFVDCRTAHPPYFAERWEWSDGDRTLTFHLRDDVVWSDGVPVTSEDVRFSQELMADPDVASPRVSYTNRIERIETPDAQTVVFRFSEAYDRETQLLHVGYPFVAKHVFAEADRASLRGHPASRSPVGAGPFLLQRWEPGSEIVLVRNERCSLAPVPWLDRVVFRVLPDPATRIAELKRGAIDLVENLNPRDLEGIAREAPHVRFLSRGYRFLDYVTWNTNDALFASREVRRALTMAIDRVRLIDTLLRVRDVVLGREATGFVPPVLCHDYAADVQPIPYDPAAARSILAREGWTDADGDGVLDRDGERFSFELLYNSGNPRREKTAVMIRMMLAEVGVEARTGVLDTNAFFEKLRRREYQAGIGGMRAALVIEPSDFWRCGLEYQYNYASYCNPRADAILEQAPAEKDLERRRSLWRELEHLVYDDQPWTFLFWREDVVGIDRRFRDVGTNVINTFHDLSSWWVPPEERKHR